jgi:hypothetical protein
MKKKFETFVEKSDFQLLEKEEKFYSQVLHHINKEMDNLRFYNKSLSFKDFQRKVPESLTFVREVLNFIFYLNKKNVDAAVEGIELLIRRQAKCMLPVCMRRIDAPRSNDIKSSILWHLLGRSFGLGNIQLPQEINKCLPCPVDNNYLQPITFCYSIAINADNYNSEAWLDLGELFHLNRDKPCLPFPGHLDCFSELPFIRDRHVATANLHNAIICFERATITSGLCKSRQRTLEGFKKATNLFLEEKINLNSPTEAEEDLMSEDENSILTLS